MKKRKKFYLFLFFCLFFFYVFMKKDYNTNNPLKIPIYSLEKKIKKRKGNGEYLLLHHFLKPQQIIFDVGANKGSWSETVLSIEPNVFIFAFEPLPNIFHSLTHSLHFDNIFSYNFAFSDKRGKNLFFCYDEKGEKSKLSSFYPKREIFTPPKLLEIKVETLDHFCCIHRIYSIDLLKIDTEGAELKVLQGAKKLLKNQKIKAIEFEYGEAYLSSHTNLKDVFKFLTDNNFIVFRIDNKGLVYINNWSDKLENLSYGNYFAILSKEMPQYGKIKNL